MVRAWFVNEARVAPLLVHPQVLKTYGVITTEDPPLIVMGMNIETPYKFITTELAQRTLKDLCDEQELKGEFDPEQLYKILMDVILRINSLHTFGIAHRDMNLGNFLFCEGVVKVSDFGLGKRIDNEMASVIVGATQTGGIGALIFRAPEVFTNKYDTMCDIWSFGVLTWMLWKVGRTEQTLAVLSSNKTRWFGEVDEDFKYFKRSIGVQQLEDLAKIRLRALADTQNGPYHIIIEKCLRLNRKNRPHAYELVGDLLRISSSGSRSVLSLEL